MTKSCRVKLVSCLCSFML